MSRRVQGFLLTSALVLSVITSLLTFHYFTQVQHCQKYNELPPVHVTFPPLATTENAWSNGLKNLSIVWATIGRDTKGDLPHLFYNLERISLVTNRTSIIFVENDSKDGTPQWIQNYSAFLGNTTNHRISQVILKAHTWNTNRKNLNTLSRARNVILDIVSSEKQFADYDLLAIVDTDMCHPWHLRNFMDIFFRLLPSKDKEWHALFANGNAHWDSDGFGDHWDRFAYRDQHIVWNPKDGVMWKFGFSKTLNNYTQTWWTNTNMNPFNCTPLAGRHKDYDCRMVGGIPLIDVHSAFGGMAFYSLKLFQNVNVTCRYESVAGDCEHIALHNCLREKLGAKLAVAPRMLVPWWGCGPGRPVGKVHESSRNLINRAFVGEIAALQL